MEADAEFALSHNLKTCFFWEAKKKQCLLKVTKIRSASYVQDATVTEHVHVAEIVWDAKT